VQPPSPSDIASFRRAAARAAKLENPAIARLIDVGEVESHPYFATEYLEGRSFASVLEEGKAHRIDLLRFLEKIARAVAYAHGRGVVHGDLKPAALLVGRRFEPRILDFGLAPIVASRPFLKRNPPSPSAYAAPESERAAPDARADVYALGVMLYEVLSGRLLHLGRTSEELKELIQAGYSRSLPPGVPSEWRTICADATAISPRERYRDAGELADQMRRALEDKPLAPRRRRRLWPFGR
jgi:serine/threonine-protein kinase